MRLADLLRDDGPIVVAMNTAPCRHPALSPSTAYFGHGCRCARCQTWRTRYDRDRKLADAAGRQGNA